MDKLAKMALLSDFYGPLLTAKQKSVWDWHYAEDLSMTEIAESEGISRQAVHDLLKRTERILLDYEEKLGLIARFLSEREALYQALELVRPLEAAHFADQTAWLDFEQARLKIREALAGITEE